MKNKKFPGWLVLLVICCVAAILLAFINLITEGPIATQQQKRFDASCRTVLSNAESFKAVEETEGIFEGVTADDKNAGYVAVVVEKGYGGEIEIVVGTNSKGTITGVQIGGANFAESPGLGAKAKEPEFTNQFAGLSYPLSLTRDGGEVDAISRATITSKAVLRGVNGAMEKLSDAGLIKIQKPTSSVTELGDNRYATSKNGFGGPVYVELLMQDGTIAEIVIGDENFAETGSYGGRAREESFYSQYIGKTGTALKLNEDIDAVSGATITSTAVNDAVNLILLYVNDPEAFQAAMEADKAPTEFMDGEYVVTANGLTSTFPVTVVITDGAVSSVALGETTGADISFLENCKNDAFTAQFTGKEYPVETVDIASGATISSKAVMNAVNDAFLKAGEAAANAPTPVENGEYSLTVNGPEGTVPMTIVVENNAVVSAKIDGKEAIVIPDPVEVIVEVPVEVIVEVPVEAAATAEAPAAGTSVTYTAEGLTGTFPVTVTVDNGAVVSVELGDASEGCYDADYLAKCKDDAFLAQFAGKSGSVEVDAVAGATISSKAIIKAVNNALKELAPAEATAAPAAEAPAAGTSVTYTAEGLTGTFPVTVTVDNGAVVSVELGDASEGCYDADYLAKCKDDAFLAQFAGKSGSVEVDAVAGATISSKAIIKAVNNALKELAPAEATAAPAAEAPAAGTSVTYTAEGLTGTFPVTVTVDNGAVVSVELGDASEGCYDADYLAKCKDDAFLAQFAGKTAPVEVDAVAGATISSKAIIKAVNKALKELAPAEATAAPAAEAPAAGTSVTYTAEGLTGTFPVTVTVDNGAVVSVELGDASEGCYDADYLAKCKDDAFLAQFAGKTAPVEVDAVAGATISSKAIIKAVNKALKELAPAEATAAPAAEAPAAGTSVTYTAEGLTGTFPVTVTVDNGAVVSVELGDASEGCYDADYLAKCKDDAFLAQFTGKTAPVEVDAVAGATISSKAIVKAVNKALTEAAK